MLTTFFLPSRGPLVSVHLIILSESTHRVVMKHVSVQVFVDIPTDMSLVKTCDNLDSRIEWCTKVISLTTLWSTVLATQ